MPLNLMKNSILTSAIMALMVSLTNSYAVAAGGAGDSGGANGGGGQAVLCYSSLNIRSQVAGSLAANETAGH